MNDPIINQLHAEIARAADALFEARLEIAEARAEIADHSAPTKNDPTMNDQKTKQVRDEIALLADLLNEARAEIAALRQENFGLRMQTEALLRRHQKAMDAIRRIEEGVL